MSFHVGQKVVALSSDWGGPTAVAFIPDLPVRGVVYHVREITVEGTELGLRLVELVNPPVEYHNVSPREPSFSANFFRPLDEKETDISALEKIARDITERKPVKITERA